MHPSHIETINLTRSFGRFFALHRVNMDLRPGRITLVLGPNGAGKSTLLGILATLDRPTSGEIRFGDTWDGARMAQEGRGLIGWVSHDSLLYADLSGTENLRFFAALYRISNPEVRIRDCLATVGLDRSEAESRLVRTYSHGMRQRLSLARALVNDPGILILDEPFGGLDEEGRSRMVSALIEAKRRDRYVILATHQFDLPQDFADWAVVLRRGRLVYQGPVQWPLDRLVKRSIGSSGEERNDEQES